MILEFLLTYKEFILLGLSALIFLITLIIDSIKGRSGLCKSMFSLLEHLPSFIIDAENRGFVDGSSKFKYVFQLSVIYLSTLVNKDIDSVVNSYGEFITNSIENILSTPEKKGETNGKKENE